MISNNFYNLLKEAVLSSSVEEIKSFFKETFLDDLLSQLDNSELPAEVIRQQRKQTIKIQNKLLTFKQK